MRILKQEGRGILWRRGRGRGEGKIIQPLKMDRLIRGKVGRNARRVERTPG